MRAHSTRNDNASGQTSLGKSGQMYGQNQIKFAYSSFTLVYKFYPLAHH